MGTRFAIKQGKKVFWGGHACSQQKGLVAVVTRAPVALPELFGHGNLGHFFSISKNAEFGFPGEDFPACLHAHLPTGMCQLRSEEHTSELQSRPHLVCRLLLEKKKEITYHEIHIRGLIKSKD